MSGRDRTRRWLTPPLGWPIHFRAVTVTPADRHPLFVWNRYPGQIIGFAVRLPNSDDPHPRCRNRGLSILWAKPARWWKR